MRFALRQLAKNPGFTVVVLLTLALGIGVNTTAFTVLNRLLLQTLPYRDPANLVQVWSSEPRDRYVQQGPGDYFDEKENNTVFEDMAAYIPSISVSLAEPGQPAVRLSAVKMTANLFAVLGVSPVLGRLPSAEEEARFLPVTLVSYEFWQEHYAGDAAVLGRLARIDGQTYTIIGVMPASLDDPVLFGGAPNFFPLDPTRLNRELRGGGWYTVAARLRPGVTLQQAQAAMDLQAARSARQYPKTNRIRTLRVIPFPATAMGDTGVTLTWLILALSGLVLVIACVNLANLQVVRTTRRVQEIGVRLALGCSRARLIQMLLLESVVLAVGGGGLGLLVALWSNTYIAHFFSLSMPLDFRVLLFTFAASLATAAVFGTIPAWIASRTDVNAALKAGGRSATSGRGRHRMRQVLVVLQLGMALVLLSVAGFFVTGLSRLGHRELGWNLDNEVEGYLQLDHDHFGEQQDPRSLQFSRQLLAALAAIPGVQAAAVSSGSPQEQFHPRNFRLEGQPAPEEGQAPYAGVEAISPGFLGVYGIPVVRGRNFLETDGSQSRPVAIVNESLARRFWPGEDPIGRRIALTGDASPKWVEIVGIVRDFETIGEFTNRTENHLKFFVPWAQANHRFMHFSVRAAGAPAAYEDTLRKVVGQLAPEIALTRMSSAHEADRRYLTYFRFIRRILMQIAGLGLLLSVIGIYGVIANLASERTREIGIRMALGGGAGAMVWLFVRNGLKLAILGVGLGLAAALLLDSALGRAVPVMPGYSPSLICALAALLFLAALAACWVPARRVARISPTLALRTE